MSIVNSKNTPSDLSQVYNVINRFMQTFVDVEPNIKKSKLTLSATADSLNLGSLDWVDVITELESVFNVRLGNIDGLVTGNIHKLLQACTHQLIQQGRLTVKQNDMIFEKYPKIEHLLWLKETQENKKLAVATVAKQNTK